MNLFTTTVIAASIASGTCVYADDIDTMRADDVKQTVRDVLAESATHKTLRGEDSPFTFSPTGFVQFRYLYNDGSDIANRHGFDVREAVLGIEGKIYDLDYRVSAEVGSDTNFQLRDAFISNDFEFATVKVGQFKTAFMSEVLVSEPDTLTGDYSIISYTFGQGRSQGVEVSKKFGDFEVRGAYSDGFNSANTDVTTDNNYGFVGRVTYGGIKNLTLGGAIAYNEESNDHATSWTFDAGYDISENLTANVGYVGRDGASEGWGVVGQIGYTVAPNCQLFGQYEYGDIDSTLNMATIGCNYNLNSNVRWTNSVGYSFDGVGSAWDVSDTGWSNSGDSQVLVRSQITFTF